jgi:hypothetical protein
VRVRLGPLSGLEAFVGKLLPGAGCQGYALCHPQHPVIAPLPACALELIAAARRRSASAKEQR